MEIEVGYWIEDAEAGRTNVQSDIAVAIHQRFRSAEVGAPFSTPRPSNPA